MKKTMLTRDGAIKLQEELDRLKQEERPRAIAAIANARDFPDFQGSSEHVQAVEHQQLIERRITELENELVNAEIVDANAERRDNRVGFGALITLRMEPEGEPICYRIVGDHETDIPAGKLSVSAPLARAVLGKEEGELVTVEAPGGVHIYRILRIIYGQ